MSNIYKINVTSLDQAQEPKANVDSELQNYMKYTWYTIQI